MSTDLFRRYGSLLKEDGTNQLQRTLPALEEGYIRPDERALPELIGYARRIAEEVRFYNHSGQPVGDWRAFLEPLLADPQAGTALSRAELEEALATRRDWPPHVALFLVFLELFKHLQDELNELPERHLRHYYEEVLALARRRPEADRLHVLFELARNAAATRLPAGTLLDAGKDGEKRPLLYATEADLVVSAAQVAEIRRLVAEADGGGRRHFFIADAVAESEGAAWHTFGRRHLELDGSERFMTEPEIGFAITSPLLLMAEGARDLTVTARLRTTGPMPTALAVSRAFQASLTGGEGWLPPSSFTAGLQATGAETLTLELTLGLTEADPAIVAHDAALHPHGPASRWPVLRLLLDPDAGRYETFRGLVVEEVDLAVDVRGVRNLLVQSDQGPLSSDQPMALFGAQPRLGSRFYIGSAEVFRKKLSSLNVNLEWQDAPESFEDHYAAYFDSGEAPAQLELDFQVALDLLYERSWSHGLLVRQPLFGFDPVLRSIPADSTAFDAAFPDGDFAAIAQTGELGPYDNSSQHGFLRLRLTGPSIGAAEGEEIPFEAFGHRAFARRYAAQAIALSRFVPGSGVEPELPNEPYTPTLAGLSLDYTAELTMVPDAPGAEEELFVVHPWGCTTAGEEVAPHLVPELDPLAVAGQEPFQGALLLGIAGLEPPANVSLLFQIEAGTASAEEILGPRDTEWSYLAGDRWRRLPPEAILNDSTYGFQQPGLVVLAVGSDATVEHTAMPAGMVWLQGLIRRPPESASRTLDLAAPAASAVFEPAAGELAEFEEHLAAGLAGESVKGLRERQATIKKASQPYASFGGRAGEADPEFFRRCSERLRHRNRAVTAWDLERLVLEAFPEVFKVKCLAHTDAAGHTRAGEAALVIVPDLRNSESENLLEPRAGAVLMSRIGEFVATELTTPFAGLHVVHPVYERIRVDARVAFHSGLDAGFSATLLDRDLQRFLSPWAFAEGEDIVFGARIYRSEVLAFMEGREYVDFITDFDLFHIHEGPGVAEHLIANPQPVLPEMAIDVDFVIGSGAEVAATTDPRAILVSDPEHRVAPIDAGEDVCTGVQTLGIGFLTIDLDFEVHPDP